jgi:hypothetical protein
MDAAPPATLRQDGQLRKHADSKHAAGTLPAIPFADQALRTALSRWRRSTDQKWADLAR